MDHHTSLVNAIWFDPSLPISLGEMVETYGAPDHVTIDQDAPDRIRPAFYWNSIRMLVSLPEISGDRIWSLPTSPAFPCERDASPNCDAIGEQEIPDAHPFFRDFLELCVLKEETFSENPYRAFRRSQRKRLSQRGWIT